MNPFTKDTINDIRANLAERLATLGVDVFGQVSAFPLSTMESFPCLVIVPSENESQYGSTASREMVFSFHINIYYPCKDESEQAGAEFAIGEAIGETLRILATKKVMSTVDWVEPVPSIWGTQTVGEAVYRTSQVIVRCRKHVALI